MSYKSEDWPRVAPMVAALEADGVSVWWDAHIGGGSKWRESIESELNAARCVLVGAVRLTATTLRSDSG